MRSQQPAQQRDAQTRRSPLRNASSSLAAAVALPVGRPSAVSPTSILGLQRSIGNAAVSRMLEAESHAHSAGCGHGTDVSVQRSTAADEVGKVLSSGGARSLDPGLQAKAETGMGLTEGSLGHVKVFHRSATDPSLTSTGSRAFTTGANVVTSTTDDHTMLHELTHVVQQSRGPVAGTDDGSGLKVSDPSDRFEREAESTATRLLSDAPVQRSTDAEHPRPHTPATLALQQTAGNAAAVELLGREPHRPAADTGIAVQRVVDQAGIEEERAAQGITGPVKIVEVPDGVTAGTPFGEYPPGHCLNLTGAELNLSVASLNGGGDPATPAAQVVSLAGGGGYLPAHRIILVNSTPEGGFTAQQTIQHEMGHLRQHEQGFNVDMAGGRRALVEYHNMLVNENPRTGAMRTEYTTADNSIVSAVRDRAQAAGIALNRPWDALIAYVAGHDPDGSQQHLLQAIQEELARDLYDEMEGGKFNRAQRRAKIKDRIGRMYFNNLFA